MIFPIGDQNEPGGRRAPVTLLIILANFAVFLLLQLPESGKERQPITYGYSTIPYEITHNVDLVGPKEITVGGERGLIDEEPGPRPIWLTIFTSMFLHGGWLHILGNMWFYLGAGVVAGIAQILPNPDSFIPSLGASGAIAGVLGAYLALFPTNRVWILVFRFIPFAVPALVAIGLWFLLNLVNGVGQIARTSRTSRPTARGSDRRAPVTPTSDTQ